MMKESYRIEHFTGRLSPKMIAEGCNLATENAARLAKDARCLFDEGRYQSAVALAALSIEESGKGHVLEHLALADDEKEAKAIWRRFRKHTEKNIFWSFRLEKGQGLIDALEKLFSKDIQQPQLLETLKQFSLYTDCVGSGRWMSPCQIAEDTIKRFAESLVKMAEFHSSIHHRTVRDIEILIECVKPVKHQPKEVIEYAIAEFMRKLQQEGLMPAEIDIAEFLTGTGSDKDDEC